MRPISRPSADRACSTALLPALAAPILAACDGPQSALGPRGPQADAAFRLTEVMSWGAAAIFALVMLLAALAILLPPHRRRWMGRRAFVVALGVAFPVATLAALLVWGLALSGALATPGPPDLRIAVEGRMWWWRVSYLDASGRTALATANEIRIPVGRPVELLLSTGDVIHSFWVPALSGKLDMIPGRVNRLVLEAERAGIYRGQCAEFCGDMHALMALQVIAEEEADFASWYAGAVLPARPPRIDEARLGAALFIEKGCGACHSIRGTAAAGDGGPDLTHVGARGTIGAGSFPNNVGTLAGWIASSQHLKPGNAMPSFDRLDGPELRAIARYLEGLK